MIEISSVVASGVGRAAETDSEIPQVLETFGARTDEGVCCMGRTRARTD